LYETPVGADRSTFLRQARSDIVHGLKSQAFLKRRENLRKIGVNAPKICSLSAPGSSI
jgi:hypothetical protein